MRCALKQIGMFFHWGLCYEVSLIIADGKLALLLFETLSHNDPH